jgi:hypothetical protein
MLGVGIGMLYTPIVVDRMQLTFPSGFAVANILRALTDVRLLRRSIATLGGGMGAGAALTLLARRAGLRSSARSISPLRASVSGSSLGRASPSRCSSWAASASPSRRGCAPKACSGRTIRGARSGS